MAANIQKRGKSKNLSDAIFPSVLVFFFFLLYLFVRSPAHEVSPLAAIQRLLKQPHTASLRAQESRCLVISSHRNESTHYV